MDHCLNCSDYKRKKYGSIIIINELDYKGNPISQLNCWWYFAFPVNPDAEPVPIFCLN